MFITYIKSTFDLGSAWPILTRTVVSFTAAKPTSLQSRLSMIIFSFFFLYLGNEGLMNKVTIFPSEARRLIRSCYWESSLLGRRGVDHADDFRRVASFTWSTLTTLCLSSPRMFQSTCQYLLSNMFSKTWRNFLLMRGKKKHSASLFLVTAAPVVTGTLLVTLLISLPLPHLTSVAMNLPLIHFEINSFEKNLPRKDRLNQSDQVYCSWASARALEMPSVPQLLDAEANSPGITLPWIPANNWSTHRKKF